MTVSRQRYFEVRSALQTLVEERNRILPRGLEVLRGWLAEGAAERWLAAERVVQQARAEDLGQAMFWDHEWRSQRQRQQQQARQEAEKQKATAPAPPKKRSTAPQRGPRRFEPGPRWVP